jgi:hypothetical protein
MIFTRLYLLVVCLAIGIANAQAQDIKHLVKFLQTKPSLTTLQQQMQRLESDSLHYIKVEKAIERVLPAGIHQLHYVCFTRQYQTFHLSVLSEKKQIISIKLFELTHSKAGEQYHTLYTWLDTTVWKHYFDKHFRRYGVKLTVNDVTLLPFRLYKYGYDCGRNTPNLYTKMRRLVRQRDEYTLQKWLRSMNVELQAYAIEGLARLQHPAKIKQNRLMELPQYTVKHKLSEKFLWKVSDTQLMQWLKLKNTLIYHCNGCFGMSLIPISSVINKMGF